MTSLKLTLWLRDEIDKAMREAMNATDQAELSRLSGEVGAYQATLDRVLGRV